MFFLKDPMISLLNVGQRSTDVFTRYGISWLFLHCAIQCKIIYLFILISKEKRNEEKRLKKQKKREERLKRKEEDMKKQKVIDCIQRLKWLYFTLEKFIWSWTFSLHKR